VGFRILVGVFSQDPHPEGEPPIGGGIPEGIPPFGGRGGVAAPGVAPGIAPAAGAGLECC